MKALTILVAVSLLLAACGDGSNQSTWSSSGGPRSEIELLNRQATSRDLLPAGAEQLLARSVIVERRSVRLAGHFSRDITIWVFKGSRSGPTALRDGQVTCLALFSRLGHLLAEKCVGESALADPKMSLVVLSGGADGAPGLRPREVLVAGLHGHGEIAPSLLADGDQMRGGGGGVYWIGTRATVKGMSFAVEGGGVVEMNFDACQVC